MRGTSALLVLVFWLIIEPSAHADPDTLAEIVVTAQKRDQNSQDVPISLSAVSGDTLESRGTHDFRDLLLSIPGLSYSGTEPGQSNYSIRGVSTGASSPTTGIYLDDVSLITIATDFSGAVDPPIFDLERIEVLKGPQGTLYGGSAMGGAIKYVTRQPDLDTVEVRSAVGAATTQDGGTSYNGESVLNLPIVADRIAMRLGVSYRDDAGYIDYVPNAPGDWPNRSATSPPAPYVPLPFASGGVIDRRNANDTQDLAGRFALKFVFDDGLTLLPQATLHRLYEAEPPYFWMNLPEFELAARVPQPVHDDLDLYSVSLTQSLGGMTLTSLSAYSDRTREWDRDYTYFVAGLYPSLLANPSSNSSVTKTTTYSEEVRLASSDPKAPLKWVAGLLYQHQSDTLAQIIHTAGAAAYFGTDTDNTYTGVQATRTEQTAGFADVTYSLTQRWDASVGLRRFDIDQTYDGAFSGVINGGSTAVKDKHSADVGLNPKVSLTYHLPDNHLLYTSTSKGFRPGGPNRFDTSSPLCAPDFAKLGIASAPASFTSDSLWTYELGSKNTFAADRILINTALYYTRWKDIQQQVNLPTCGFQFIGNVGAAVIKGAELELQAVLVTGVRVGTAVSYSNSAITETAAGVSAQVGQPLLDTPLWAGSVWLEVALPTLAGWSGKLHTDYAYHGTNIRQFDSTAVVTFPGGSSGVVPDQTQVQHAYDVANLALESVKGPWQLRLYVDNLTNSAPVLDDSARIFNTPNITTLRPRTVGLLVRTLL